MIKFRKYTPQTQAHSNTGHIGVSEVTAWLRSHGGLAKPYPCFVVNWRDRSGLDKNSPGGKRRTKRFFYRDTRSRGAALKTAVNFRQQKIKEQVST